MKQQDTIFWKTEGDNWFKRNRHGLNKEGAINNADSALMQLLEKHAEVQPKRVLEIGCANGWRLEELRKKYQCDCTGIDPSAEAIAEGKELFPEITFQRALASDLPLDTSFFDLVIVNFVYHWVPRNTLLQSVAETDRVLQEGGFLLLGDFLPDAPCRRLYHHLPGQHVYTFKQDYAEIFLSAHLYLLIDRLVFQHDTKASSGTIPEDKRGACSLLQKTLEKLYRES